MKTEDRIRARAATLVRVSVTRRKRNPRGFLVERPNGTTTHHLTKREAMQALSAQLRCAPVQLWRVIPVEA